jgi:hypothetical protein
MKKVHIHVQETWYGSPWLASDRPSRSREARAPRWARRAEQDLVPENLRSERVGAMTDVDMWGVLAQAATILDSADCDWRTLQQIESLLSALSTELERLSAAESARSQDRSSARQGDSDLLSLRDSLAWVRRHEYVAQESELQKQLETALRCALGTLDRLDLPTRGPRWPSLPGTASGDWR